MPSLLPNAHAHAEKIRLACGTPDCTDIRTLRVIIRNHDLGLGSGYAAALVDLVAVSVKPIYGDVSLTSSDSNRIGPSSKRAMVMTC